MDLRRSLAVASAALVAQAACANTSYTPRGDGRIVQVLEDGTPVLMKDGKRLPSGTDGINQAVTGNPAAEEHARSYAQGVHMALAESLIGLGALIAGAIVAAPHQDEAGNDVPASRDRRIGGSVLFFGGLAVMIVSGFQTASAQAHYMDAINIYNDGVPPRFGAPPPAAWRPTSPVPLSPPPGEAPRVIPGPPAPAAPVAPTGPQAYPPPPQSPPPVPPSPN
jgi:hypothetical protein